MDTLHLESPKHGSFRAIIILLFLFIFPLKTATESTTFNFTQFSLGMPEISFQGDAYTANKTIKLTKTSAKLIDRPIVGRAIYFKQFHFWDKASGLVADFDTHFSFVINSNGKTNIKKSSIAGRGMNSTEEFGMILTKGSGMTFFLTPNTSQLPLSSPNRGDIGLSSEWAPNNERPIFVAVEFDTEFNYMIDPPNCQDHIGIDISSMDSAKYVNWSFNDISNGGRIEAWVHYDSSSKNLSVSVTNGAETNYTRIYSYSLFLIKDLTEYLTEWVTIGFSAATTGYTYEDHEIHSWEFSSSLKPKRKNNGRLWAFMGVGGTLLLVLVVCFGYWRMKRRRQQREGSRPGSSTNQKFENDDAATDDSMDHELEQGTGPKRYSYKELVQATNNFSEDGKLGEGGFGGVYKGYLSDLSVAVKRVSKTSKQGRKEYMSEVKIINRLRHKNLVQLVGWCHEKGDLLLIYEFMPNGSLDFHLFRLENTLPWSVRYNIALGLASALLYFHEESEQCVVHRDIKSSNVMLDSNFNTKLGDFGLARFMDNAETGLKTTALAGTFGYMAPEYINTGKASRGSDVFSFGIVALEIACGRRSMESRNEEAQISLVSWVWGSYGNWRILDVADRRLNMDFNVKEMECLLIVGLWCAHPDYSLRPSIRQALQVLKFESALPNIPAKMPIPKYDVPSSSSSSTDPLFSTTVLATGR